MSGEDGASSRHKKTRELGDTSESVILKPVTMIFLERRGPPR